MQPVAWATGIHRREANIYPKVNDKRGEEPVPRPGPPVRLNKELIPPSVTGVDQHRAAFPSRACKFDLPEPVPASLPPLTHSYPLTMHSHGRLGASLLCLAGLATAQVRYADNQVATVKDTAVIAKNFPDVEGVELQSPAFSDPDSVPEAFTNGTVGPTSQETMGMAIKTPTRRVQSPF